MSGRFHPHFLAEDYDRFVVAKRKCLVDGPPEKYRPLFTVVDFPSHGFRTFFGSWIVGRPMHPVSTPEYHAVAALHAPGRGVVNICEQVALEPPVTQPIARALKVRHPSIHGKDVIMSTDLLITYRRPGGLLEREAWAVKQGKDLTDRVLQKLAIEHEYWAQRNTKWRLLVAEKIPPLLVSNMELLMEFQNHQRLPCNSDTAERVISWICENRNKSMPLRIVGLSCDAALGLECGTSLSVIYHAIMAEKLTVDLNGSLLPNSVEPFLLAAA